jgi:hypothetical protein
VTACAARGAGRGRVRPGAAGPRRGSGALAALSVAATAAFALGAAAAARRRRHGRRGAGGSLAGGGAARRPPKPPAPAVEVVGI